MLFYSRHNMLTGEEQLVGTRGSSGELPEARYGHSAVMYEVSQSRNQTYFPQFQLLVRLNLYLYDLTHKS